MEKELEKIRGVIPGYSVSSADLKALKKSIVGLLADSEGDCEIRASLEDDDFLASAGPSLLRFLQDRASCRSCRSLATCPKKGRSGRVYSLVADGESFALKDNFCQRRREREQQLSNLVFCEREIEAIERVGSAIISSVKEMKSIKESKSFWTAALTAAKSIASFQAGRACRGLTLSAPNANSDAVCYFAAALALEKKLRTAVVDVDRSLAGYYIDREQRLPAEWLRRVAGAEVIVLFNLDHSPKRVAFLDGYLLPFLRAVTGPSRLLFCSLHAPLAEACVFGYKEKPEPELLNLLLRATEEKTILEPNLFDLR